MAPQSMKALNYAGPYKVRIEDIEAPKLEHPDDVIVRVTTVSCVVIATWLGRIAHLLRRQFADQTCSK